MLLLFHYVDFMIESGPVSRVKRFEKLALKYIDNSAHKGQGDDILYSIDSIYNVQPLPLCRREHISCLMYNLSHDYEEVNLYRPRENLRCNK